MISTIPAAMGQVNASPNIAAAKIAVAAVPDAPQMPYATPTGMPALRTIVSSTNEPT